MSKRHLAVCLLIGWAIAWVFPPQRLVAMFKGNKGA